MIKTRLVVGLGLAALLAACGGSSGPNRSGMTNNKLYQVSYEPSPNPIPFSQLFSLDVTIKDAKGKPVDGCAISLKVLMPAHGHGMQTAPQVVADGGGHYTINGMKFHMYGLWTIQFNVTGPDGVDSILFDENYGS